MNIYYIIGYIIISWFVIRFLFGVYCRVVRLWCQLNKYMCYTRFERLKCKNVMLFQVADWKYRLWLQVRGFVRVVRGYFFLWFRF